MKLDISGVRLELDAKLKSHVNKKIKKLDRYVPRGARQPSIAKVVLTEDQGNAKNRFSCEVTITVPHGTLTAKDAASSAYAAVDIVEGKLKAQLSKHKNKLIDHRPHRRILRRLRRINPF